MDMQINWVYDTVQFSIVCNPKLKIKGKMLNRTISLATLFSAKVLRTHRPYDMVHQGPDPVKSRPKFIAEPPRKPASTYMQDRETWEKQVD